MWLEAWFWPLAVYFPLLPISFINCSSVMPSWQVKIVFILLNIFCFLPLEWKRVKEIFLFSYQFHQLFFIHAIMTGKNCFHFVTVVLIRKFINAVLWSEDANFGWVKHNIRMQPHYWELEASIPNTRTFKWSV